MSDYPAIFHLRVCRAMQKIEHLSERLQKVHGCCQRDENGEYSKLEAVDGETLELLVMLSDDIRTECTEARRALINRQQLKP